MGWRKAAGDTLIELEMTALVAAILVAAALPLVGVAMEKHRLNAAPGRFLSDARSARSKAVSVL